MNRWDLVRERIEQHLGPRTSAKDRRYRLRREALARELGITDVTLKGFLPAQAPKTTRRKSGTLGIEKLRKLLLRSDFHDLRGEFPEIDLSRSQVWMAEDIQLELDFQGFDISPQTRVVRLPAGAEGELRLTIKRIA